MLPVAILFSFTLTLPAFGGLKAEILLPTKEDCLKARRAIQIQLRENSLTHTLTDCYPVHTDVLLKGE